MSQFRSLISIKDQFFRRWALMGFVISFLTALIIGVGALYTLRLVITQKNEIVFDHADDLIKAERMRSLLEREHLQFRSYLLTDDKDFLNAYEFNRKEFYQLVESLKKQIVSLVGKTQLEDIVKIEKDIHQVRWDIISNKKNLKINTDILRILKDEILARQTKLDERLNGFISRQNNQFVENREKQFQNDSKFLISILLLILLVMITGAGFSLALAKLLFNYYQKTQESVERFRALVEASSQMVWLANEKGEFLTNILSKQNFDEQLAQGWSSDGPLRLIHQKDQEQFRKNWYKAIEEKNAFEAEFRQQHHNGNWRWLNCRGVPLKKADGVFRGWVGVCTDITVEKDAKKKWRNL